MPAEGLPLWSRCQSPREAGQVAKYSHQFLSQKCAVVHLMDVTNSVSGSASPTEEHDMAELSPTSRRPNPQERHYRRFSLRYPIDVKFHSENSVSELRAISRNISLSGVLLETDVTADSSNSETDFRMKAYVDRIA